MTKRATCRFAMPDFSIVADDGTKKVKVVTYCKKTDKRVDDSVCDKCELHDSKFITYPITVNDICVEKMHNDCCSDVGRYVRIKPCSKKYNDKTFLGIYLGSLQVGSGISYNEVSGVLDIIPHTNPAIFVFELNQIIFGFESFWSFIESEKEFSEITSEEINNTWYVKFFNSVLKDTSEDGKDK